MFTPDSQEPCKSLIEFMQKGDGIAPKPCIREWMWSSRCRYYHFWPDEQPCVQAEVLKSLYNAKRSIHLCMFSITNKNLSDCLIYLVKERGVKVRIITDWNPSKRQGNDQIPVLKNAGLDLGLVGPNQTKPTSLMHNKFCIVDEKLMIMGSPNWTNCAFSANNEIIIFIENPLTIARVKREFNKLYKSE